MVADNLIAHPQPQPCPGRLLGRKERFKHAPPCLLVHPIAVVCDTHPHSRPPGLPVLGALRAEPDLSRSRNRIQSIPDQVRKHLPHISRKTHHLVAHRKTPLDRYLSRRHSPLEQAHHALHDLRHPALRRMRRLPVELQRLRHNMTHPCHLPRRQLRIHLRLEVRTPRVLDQV